MSLKSINQSIYPLYMCLRLSTPPFKVTRRLKPVKIWTLSFLNGVGLYIKVPNWESFCMVFNRNEGEILSVKCQLSLLVFIDTSMRFTSNQSCLPGQVMPISNQLGDDYNRRSIPPTNKPGSAAEFSEDKYRNSTNRLMRKRTPLTLNLIYIYKKKVCFTRQLNVN